MRGTEMHHVGAQHVPVVGQQYQVQTQLWPRLEPTGCASTAANYIPTTNSGTRPWDRDSKHNQSTLINTIPTAYGYIAEGEQGSKRVHPE